VERLTGLSAALAGATSSVAIARAVVDEAAEALGASVGLFYAVDPAVGSLELVHARGYPPGLARSHATLAADAPLPAAVAARERRTVEIAGTSGWRQTTRGATDVLAITGTRSLIARPVGSHDGTVSGVLVIQRTTEDALAADEREFLDAVTDQAAQALDRARLYEALDDRDRRLSLTLAASRTGTWELDLASGRVTLSPELRRIHGLGVDTTVEGVDGLASLVSDRDSGRFRSALRRASETGRPFELDYAVVRPDGTAAWAHVAGRGFADEPADEQTRPARPGDPSARPAVRRVMGVVRETTDQVLAEAERDQLLEHEREARRLQEAFIGIISHELRTPITTVLAGSKLLLRQPGLQEQGRDLVSDIESEADRLYRLVEDLLVLSRLERGNLEVGQEPVHIGHVANRVVASERVRWPATRFELVYEGRHRVVRGEETYVEQVVRNLVANAAKYSPPGSTVTVRVASDDGSASVTVLDEGPGILGDEADELFTLFYRSPRTAASASGAGIGLFVCQRLVGAMGGRIWATRRPTGGSEFGFALELFEEDEFDLEPPAEAAAGRRLW